MSRPFAIALLGLIVAIVILATGQRSHGKAAVPLAFLVGGTMMIGGVVIGILRELRRKG